MGESRSDQLARLKLMARGDDQWDLSPNDCAAIKMALNDIMRLDWIIEEFNRPDVDTAHTGAMMGRIIAGGIVGDDIYPDSRSAIDAARGRR